MSSLDHRASALVEFFESTLHAPRRGVAALLGGHVAGPLEQISHHGRCGTLATCNPLWNAGYSRNASDFNSASIAIGDLAGTETVTRKVTNVSGSPLTVTANVSGMAGFTTVVSPNALTLAPGATQAFTGTITRTTAATPTIVRVDP